MNPGMHAVTFSVCIRVITVDLINCISYVQFFVISAAIVYAPAQGSKAWQLGSDKGMDSRCERLAFAFRWEKIGDSEERGHEFCNVGGRYIHHIPRTLNRYW